MPNIDKKVDEQTAQDARILASIGYQDSFRRAFNQYSTLSYAVSVLGVLGSVPATFGVPFALGGPATAVWAWFTGTFMSLTVAASVAELVSAYPTAGGMYTVTQKVVPSSKAPLLSWIVGWSNFLGQTAGVGSLGYTISQQILAVVTMLSLNPESENPFLPTAWHTVLLAILVLMLVGVVCSLPTKLLHQSIFFFAPFQLIAAIAICIALLTSAPSLQQPSWVFGKVADGSGWGSPGFSFLLGFASVAWVMTDYDGVTHMSEETRNPAKRGPIAIVLAIVIAGAIGLLLNITLAFCVQDYELTLTSPTGLAAAQVLYDVGGPVQGSIMWVFVIITQALTCCAAMLADTRMAFAFARDRALPFSKTFAQVNKTTVTPVNAVWLVVALAITLNLIAIGSVETSTAIFNVTAPALDLSYITVIGLRRYYASQITFRPGPFHLGRWSLPLNIIAIIWVLFISAVLFFPNIRPITVANFNYASCVGAALFIFALIWWHAGAKRYYKGPSSSSSLETHSRQSDEEDTKLNAHKGVEYGVR